jgi:hypothetical protein
MFADLVKLFVSTFLLTATPAALAGGLTPIYSLESSAMSAGGTTTSTGGVYALSGTIGQPTTTLSSAGSFTLQAGFWRSEGLRGDANASGTIDVADVFALINHLFAGSAIPDACLANANGDGVLDVADVFFLVNYLFAGGPAPPPGC